jgi:starch synthase
VRVLFASAEFAPLARVGGLAAAAAGLAAELRRQDVDVHIVLPDYFETPLSNERIEELVVPAWAAPAVVRTGTPLGAAAAIGEVSLVSTAGIARPHPYVDAAGIGFADNDVRFFGFSAAVAALCTRSQPDVLHLNDWHCAAALAFIDSPPPVVLTIHTLGYQGTTNDGWLSGFPHHAHQYRVGNTCNPLAGAIRLADLVVTVSPTYAREIVTPAGGFGLDGELRERGKDVVGILNGIDTSIWDPNNDPLLPMPYAHGAMEGKAAAHAALCAELGLASGPGPLMVVVTRLAEQKGIDLILPALHLLPTVPARLAVLGDGDASLAEQLQAAAAAAPTQIAFHRGYDEGLAHRLFAGGDLFLMPSRFEPCGLAQMQAMRYGTIPIVTDVGGLHDTVLDIDLDPVLGTGAVAASPTALDVLDALHRGVRAVGNQRRRDAMRRRAMAIDWSWAAPAHAHVMHYERLIAQRNH